jgi:peptidoglycan/LPS O-acetylase OafA/YrhL
MQKNTEMSAHEKVVQLDGLTSLRFFAAFYVLLFHYTLVDPPGPNRTDLFVYGYSGVSFFFILSGFILSYNYKNTDFGDAKNINKFLLARFARIYPVYIFSLLIAVPFLLSAVAKHKTNEVFAIAGIIYAPLGLHAWIPGAACTLNCPSWSISTEFFFYLIFPFVMPLVFFIPIRWVAISFILFVLSGAVMSGVWAVFGDGGYPLEVSWDRGQSARLASDFAKFFPPARLPEFISGIVLFVFWRKYGKAAQSRRALVLALAGGVTLAFLGNWLPAVLMHNGLTALCWIPIIWAGANSQRGLITSKPLVFLGKISYSLYLTHGTVLAIVGSIDKRLFSDYLKHHPFLSLLVATLSALCASALVYLFIEEPFRHAILRRWRPPAPQMRGAA